MPDWLGALTDHPVLLLWLGVYMVLGAYRGLRSVERLEGPPGRRGGACVYCGRAGRGEGACPGCGAPR